MFFIDWLFGPKMKPKVFAKVDHRFKVENVDKNALKVLERLDSAGYQAYLVGGVIRDGLLGIKSKDCDVATNAKPERIVKRLKNSIIVGRRFKLVHARFGRKVIEVSTFRSNATSRARKIAANGIIRRDNVYGRIEDDVMRRDFTINALYYRFKDHCILDFVGGMEDLKKKRLRSIGDPDERFPEDPVRMLRAVRFAAKLDFEMEENIRQAIRKHRHLLTEISGQRLFSEVVKLYYSGYAQRAQLLLEKVGLIEILVPGCDRLKHKDDALKLWRTMCANADQRQKEGKKLSVTYLFACLYWPLVAERTAKKRLRHFSQAVAIEVLNQALVDVPFRVKEDICEIWKNQYLFKLRDKAPKALGRSKRLRASYELLSQRAIIYSRLTDVALYWAEHVGE